MALHNNSAGQYSATSYLPGQELASYAADIHLQQEKDPDDFFFVTEQSLFEALSAHEFNVVLQDNRSVTDDGSLSVYCGQQSIPYVNVEAQYDHQEEQQKMIEALLDILSTADQHMPGRPSR